jgi:hypothetical protein
LADTWQWLLLAVALERWRAGWTSFDASIAEHSSDENNGKALVFRSDLAIAL